MEKTTTFMRRGILAGLIAVCACALCFALTACGPSDEDQAKEALDNQLSLFVSPSDDTINTLSDEIGSADSGAFSKLNIDKPAFVKSWLSGFSYEIGDVKVDGDTAKAETKVTCKQLYVITDNWTKTFEDRASSQGLSSIDEAYTYAGKTFMDDLDGADTTTTTVTFTLEKDGGDWTFADNTDNGQALADCLLGGGADASFFQN